MAVRGQRTVRPERTLKFSRISVHVKRKYAIVKSQTWGGDQVPQCAVLGTEFLIPVPGPEFPPGGGGDGPPDRPGLLHHREEHHHQHALHRHHLRHRPCPVQDVY